MLGEHDKETPQLEMTLDPDFGMYKKMHEVGALRIFTARIADVLVGYQIYFVSYHPHRRGSLEATQDVLYLDPEVRKGFVAIKFIRWCDETLARAGVKAIHHPIDADHNFGAILQRMGYRLTDLVFSKKLEAV